jgi:hypothetical protein
MSPGESAYLAEWARLPPVAPSPSAVVAGIVLLALALVAALWLSDARAAAPAPRPDGALRRAVPASGAPEQSPDDGEALEPARLRLDDLGAGALQALAAARLRHFVEVAGDPALDADAARRCLARRAVFSAYRDCLALGLDEEARALLRTPPAQPAEPPPGVAAPAGAPAETGVFDRWRRPRGA